MMDSNAKIYLNILSAILICFSLSYAQTKDQMVEAKIWKGIGGKENWQNVRYFMFSCIGGESNQLIEGERKYLWDKQTGDCRFEGVNADGETIITLFNLKTLDGSVFVNDLQVDDQNMASTMIEETSIAFERDANLLFLPTTLEGKDVWYTVEDEKLLGSKRYMVVYLQNHKTSFETTVDGRLYIDEQTGLVQHWLPKYTDQSTSNQYAISGFKDVGGGLVLPTHFEGNNQGTSITYPLAAALINIEANKFNRP